MPFVCLPCVVTDVYVCVCRTVRACGSCHARIGLLGRMSATLDNIRKVKQSLPASMMQVFREEVRGGRALSPPCWTDEGLFVGNAANARQNLLPIALLRVWLCLYGLTASDGRCRY